jgi:hypothetical protein
MLLSHFAPCRLLLEVMEAVAAAMTGGSCTRKNHHFF